MQLENVPGTAVPHSLACLPSIQYNVVMSGDLLRTKLYVPQRPLDRQRHALVPRPRLVKKLDVGLDNRLTLISAPAGFGKTTLVSEWIADGKRPFAWFSLDERDSVSPAF